MLLDLDSALTQRNILRAAGQRLVFTNGHFDLLHVGHLDYLEKARGPKTGGSINSQFQGFEMKAFPGRSDLRTVSYTGS